MKKIIFIIIGIGLIILVNSLFFTENVYIEKKQKITNCDVCLVTNENTAIKIAEAILFDYYGKEKIENERPYTIDLMPNNTWLIRGSLSKNFFEKILYPDISMLGGSFEILINGKDGQVISITHYK